MKHIVSPTNIETVLQNFGAHLLRIRGLSQRTCASRIFYIREFLRARLKAGRGRLKYQDLSPTVVLQHVLERSRHDAGGRLQALASALRSFGRFLQMQGHGECDWANALPRIAAAGPRSVSNYLTPAQLQALLHAPDRRTQAGRRDYAILLCLARLGLRAGEAARLTVDQIHWRAGFLRLAAGKGRRERELPLPKDAGEALVHYLQKRAPQGGSRRVFRGLRTGQSLSAPAISQVVRRALGRAGLSVPRAGAHLLRRTLASHLVQQGGSLKAVADLLGHQCLETTRIYACLTPRMLLDVACPWPQEGGQ